jgi:glycosyltransferase 2 family protein
MIDAAPAPEAAERSGLTKAALLAAKMLFSFGLFAFLFTRMPLASVIANLEAASPPLLIGAFVVLFLSNVLGAWQWWHLLEVVGIRIPFRKVLGYYHVGLFFNNFLPANIGGDIARVVHASRYGETRAAAVSTVVLDRLVGTVALAGLAVVTTVPAIKQFHLGILYLALVGFLVVSVVMLWGVLHPRVLPAIETVMSRVGLKFLEPHLDDLAHRFAAYRARGRLFAGLLAMATLIQVMRVGVHVLVARALGVNLPLPYFFLFVPLLAVIVSLPISLNGIGVREGAGMVLFSLVGVDRSRAFSLQFTTYLVAVAVSLLGAGVLLGRMLRRSLKSRGSGRSS